jgi:bacterioferritin
MLTGHSRPELRSFFLSEIQEELGHAQFLADKVTALGGTPTTEPAKVQLAGDNKEMVEIALRAEKETIERYKKRIDQADEVGDVGLRVRLEDIVSDETQHKEDMERILANWKG